MIKLVIFDLDGLLVDSERKMWLPNEKRVAKEYGVELDENEVRAFMGGSKDTTIEFFKNLFKDKISPEEYFQRLFAYNEISVNNNEVPLKEGAQELLEFLKNNNIKVSLGTSSFKPYATKILTNLNVIDYFDNITTVENVKRGKPFPDIYEHAFNQFNFNKDEVLVLEDAHNGCVAANEAGLKVVMVEDFAILNDYDYENSLKVVHSLLDVIEIIKKENNLK